MAEHRVEHHKEHRAHGGHEMHRARGGASSATEEAKELAEDEKEAKGKDRWIDKETEKEAEADGFGGHKRGGHVKKHEAKRKHGGKVHHHAAMHVDGKAAHHRMDRAPRKRGGGVGAEWRGLVVQARQPVTTHLSVRTYSLYRKNMRTVLQFGTSPRRSKAQNIPVPQVRLGNGTVCASN